MERDPKHTIPGLAIALAQAAIHGEVAVEVIRLLSGGCTEGLARAAQSDKIAPATSAAPKYQKEKVWDGENKGPECSDPTSKSSLPEEDDGELSRLMQQVRKRRISRTRSAKRKSS